MNQTLSHSDFMQVAITEAITGVQTEEGGPFGAVVVKDGKIIARAHNQVVQFNDPTCHAEIQAIRKACASLGRFDLSDCELYTSCEPCPMCYGAIHWAKLTKVYVGALAEDAAASGFDDKFIYDSIRGLLKPEEEQVEFIPIDRENCLTPFKVWDAFAARTQY